VPRSDGPAMPSARSTRTSPKSLRRCAGSRCRHQPSTSRTRDGSPAGSRAQSGSRLTIAPSTSAIDSPLNALLPDSIS
jgi:hypothetical protein